MPSLSVSQVAKQLNVAPSSIRNYTRDERFKKHLSDSATPSAGSARQLSPSDVRVLQYITESSKAGVALSVIAARLDSGALTDFEPEPTEPELGASTALILREFSGARLAVQEFANRLEESHLRETELLRELGEVKAELREARALLTERSIPWWRRLFGRK